LTVGRVQINLNSSLCQNTFRVNTQQSGVQLANQIEFDFLKIGHRVKGQKIFSADTGRITFRADILNGNTIDTNLISYAIGTPSQSTHTSNPLDFPLVRTQNGSPITQQYGLLAFCISYYNVSNIKMSTPISTQNRLDSIRSIRVKFLVESPDAVISYTDTTYSDINWEKLLFPRNLGKKDY
jgi:hypothetical protein